MDAPELLRSDLRETYRSLADPGAKVRIPRDWNWTTEPVAGHFHLRPEVFLQRGGTTRFSFPDEVLDLGPGEILIVPARLHHAEQVIPGGQPFRNVVLYADDHGFSCHLADGTPGTGPRIAHPEHREGPLCSAMAHWIADAVGIGVTGTGPSVCVDLMRSVLGMALKLLDEPARGPNEPLTVTRCRRMVHEELGNSRLSVALLAQRLGCSADYLSHLFRTVRGEKLTLYIEGQRLGRAAELLRDTSLSVKEVAWASGFANQSYFIRCFRHRWGTSPGLWRQRSSDQDR